MQLPSVSTRPDELELINRVLTLVGLMPVGFDSHEISAGSDAGIIRTIMIAQAREIQTKGWWFNTWEDYFIESGTLAHFLPNGKTPLAIEPSPRSDCESQGVHYELFENTIVAREDSGYAQDYDEHADTYLDVVFAVDLIKCPTEFNDYLVYRTARMFGRSIGMKIDPYDEQVAYQNLVERNERSSKPRNWFKESSIARI